MNDDKLLSTFLKGRGVYTSKFYFVLHSYFEIFNSDFLEHDLSSMSYCRKIGGKCAFCSPSVLEMAHSAGSYSPATMVNSEQGNQKLSWDYDRGDLEWFFARDTARFQEESLAAPPSDNKPHEDLSNSSMYGTESDKASEIVCHQE